METEFSPAQFNWSNLRPAELERLPLSGQTVNVRSHGGTGVGFRGKEYKPKKDGIIYGLPVEAVQQIEGATYWFNGKASNLKFDIVEAASEKE
jgi:hypothetical protein